MESKLVTALLAHYQSEIQTAEANLLVYFKHPAGIGEHGEVVQEMVKHVDRIAHAKGCIDILNQLTKPNPETATAQ